MRNKNYAFTLLEVLIVIVIIGILASLAIPNFIKTTESAKGKEAVVNLDTIRTAERMYYLNRNHYTNSQGGGYQSLNNQFNELIPDYLPENPNVNSTDWQYDFSVGAGNTCEAIRQGGAYNNGYVTMYMNGQVVPNEPVW